MKTYKIAVIPGDGVGPEVLTEGMKVLKRVAELDGTFQIEDTWFPWGCEYYLKTGRMMPEDGIEILEKFDAIYLGAVGYPGVPDHISQFGTGVKMENLTKFKFKYFTCSGKDNKSSSVSPSIPSTKQPFTLKP